MGKWTTRSGPAMARLRQAIKDADKIQTRVGWFETSIYPDGTPVAYVAAIQEYGDPSHNIPPRSYMRTTQDEQKDRWFELMGKGIMQIPSGRQTVRSVMELLGLQVEADVRKKITLIYDPKLQESTLRARAHKLGVTRGQVSTKPLNATGYMLATLTSITSEDKGK